MILVIGFIYHLQCNENGHALEYRNVIVHYIIRYVCAFNLNLA